MSKRLNKKAKKNTNSINSKNRIPQILTILLGIFSIIDQSITIIDWIEKNESKNFPISIYIPPYYEVENLSTKVVRNSINEIHIGWNNTNKEIKKTNNKIYKFDFEIFNDSDIMQTGKIHFTFYKNINKNIQNVVGIEETKLFVENGLNDFIMEDPYKVTKINRTYHEDDKTLIVNFDIENLQPKKSYLFHLYLNYLPNAALELKNNLIEATASPIFLQVEASKENKTFDLGKIAIYNHINNGIGSLITTVNAFTDYYYFKTISNYNIFFRFKEYLKYSFPFIENKINKIILVPTTYIANYDSKDEVNFVIVSTGIKDKNKPTWEIYKLTYDIKNYLNPFKDNSIMTLEEFEKMRNKTIESIK